MERDVHRMIRERKSERGRERTRKMERDRAKEMVRSEQEIERCV
jgi:hypothetical protein